MIIPVVLAGGVGSRLWPVSRQLYPKQFTALSAADGGAPHQGETLFQSTLTRLRGVADLAAPIVVCNEEHRFLTAQQLKEAQIDSANILLEPVGRNTAPAVAVAAIRALELGENPTLLVLPADHAIKDSAQLRAVVSAGAQLAQQGKLVTFGIVPTAPETGYGYIRRGQELETGLGELSYKVDSFVEKPNLSVAESYLSSGQYYWNSGMFMFTAARFLQELEECAPDILNSCRESMSAAQSDVDFIRICPEEFAQCRSDSIDYAVMEKTQDGVVMPLDAQWSDLGAWNSLWEASTKDEQENVLTGDVICEEVEGSYIHSHSRLVAAVGVKDLVLVETADAVLVAAKDKVQEVKRIVQRLEQAGRAESVHHVLVYRPWGSYESLAVGAGFQVKHIVVKPGGSLSLQMHHHRAEHWVVVKGSATVTCEEKVFVLKENESTFIPLGSKHRLQNRTSEPVEIIEVQTGSYLGEDDIVRFDDVYGRAPDTTQ
ncbi:MAG: mannose-1-phosphate guanylyltransferase/mannose-6-phosphate isomerase [Pseudohongiellaceae bacterium]|nr:mannose-1-phosphate guanylyltransferase/mannose-6-phosphate isomerase [Pseudohongiellaceae bacterium]